MNETNKKAKGIDIRSPKHIHVVFFSGGYSSWQAARRLRERLGPDEPITLLFTDTNIEDDDLYNSLGAMADDVGGDLVIIAEGRDPWEVFRDVKYIGNTRSDPCSRILKREPALAWIRHHCDPFSTTLYFGISWDESERLVAVRANYAKKGWYDVEAPMCDKPYVALGREARRAEYARIGLREPRLYRLGFSHNNCGGFCVKAGLGHFKKLLAELPELYAHHEAQEQATREIVGDYAILRDRRGGETKPMTLKVFRERVEADVIDVNPHDLRGCGCFTTLDDDGVATHH